MGSLAQNIFCMWLSVSYLNVPGNYKLNAHPWGSSLFQSKELQLFRSWKLPNTRTQCKWKPQPFKFSLSFTFYYLVLNIICTYGGKEHSESSGVGCFPVSETFLVEVNCVTSNWSHFFSFYKKHSWVSSLTKHYTVFSKMGMWILSLKICSLSNYLIIRIFLCC